MNQEKIRMIVRNMELLVHSLKQELEAIPDKIITKEDAIIGPYEGDYDEVFGE
jgi:hypothetical protein